MPVGMPSAQNVINDDLLLSPKVTMTEDLI